MSSPPPRERLPAAFSDHRPLSIIRYHGFCVVADRPNQPTKPIPTLIDPTPRGEGGRTVRSRYRNTTSIKSTFFLRTLFMGKCLQGLMALCIIGKVDFVFPFGCVLQYYSSQQRSLPFPRRKLMVKKIPVFLFSFPFTDVTLRRISGVLSSEEERGEGPPACFNHRTWKKRDRPGRNWIRTSVQ